MTTRAMIWCYVALLICALAVYVYGAFWLLYSR